MIIRQGEVRDFGNIMISLREMHEEASTETYFGEFNENIVSQHVLASINNGMVIVAYNEEGRFLGSIGSEIGFNWWNNEQHVADKWIFVREAHRGSSAAVRLVKEFIRLGKEAGFEVRIGQITGVDTERKDKFFKKIGMKRQGSLFVI